MFIFFTVCIFEKYVNTQGQHFILSRNIVTKSYTYLILCAGFYLLEFYYCKNCCNALMSMVSIVYGVYGGTSLNSWMNLIRNSKSLGENLAETQK